MGHRRRRNSISKARQRRLRQHRKRTPPLLRERSRLMQRQKLDPGKDAAIRHLMDITEVSNWGKHSGTILRSRYRTWQDEPSGTGKVQKFMDTFSTQFNANASPIAVTDAMVTIYAKNFSMEIFRA